MKPALSINHLVCQPPDPAADCLGLNVRSPKLWEVSEDPGKSKGVGGGLNAAIST